MKQQCRQHAHHQHDGQSLQREHEFGAGHLEVVGELAAAEITEDEGGAGSAGGGDRPDRIVDPGEDAATPGTLSRMRAVANVSRRPAAADFHATARRCSLMIQAKARRAPTPSSD